MSNESDVAETFNKFFVTITDSLGTRKLSARFARASTFLAPAKDFQRISHNPC